MLCIKRLLHQPFILRGAIHAHTCATCHTVSCPACPATRLLHCSTEGRDGDGAKRGSIAEVQIHMTKGHSGTCWPRRRSSRGSRSSGSGLDSWHMDPAQYAACSDSMSQFSVPHIEGFNAEANEWSTRLLVLPGLFMLSTAGSRLHLKCW